MALKLLVIDDHPLILEGVAAALEGLGHGVRIVAARTAYDGYYFLQNLLDVRTFITRAELDRIFVYDGSRQSNNFTAKAPWLTAPPARRAA